MDNERDVSRPDSLPWRRDAFCAVVGVLVAADARSEPVRRPIWRHDVVRAYPHDPEAFTQGLVYRDGVLYESTGLNGRSSLRRVALETGRVLQRQSVDRRYFAEGLASWGPNLLQLTWDTNVAFVYDRASFRLLRTFTYAGEGWGLADDGRQLDHERRHPDAPLSRPRHVHRDAAHARCATAQRPWTT